MKKKTIIILTLILITFSTIGIGKNTRVDATENYFANKSIYTTLRHDALLYTRKGKRTKIKYPNGKRLLIDNAYVLIKSIPYSKVTGTNYYIKTTNFDGITRKIKHKKAYVYHLRGRRISRTRQKNGIVLLLLVAPIVLVNKGII